MRLLHIVLAFEKTITCSKKSFEATMAPIQNQEPKLEFGKGEAEAWELHQILCEFVGGICWDFLCVLLFVVGEEDPIGFS